MVRRDRDRQSYNETRDPLGQSVDDRRGRQNYRCRLVVLAKRRNSEKVRFGLAVDKGRRWPFRQR